MRKERGGGEERSRGASQADPLITRARCGPASDESDVIGHVTSPHG